jgi:hypothetical protein
MIFIRTEFRHCSLRTVHCVLKELCTAYFINCYHYDLYDF